MPQPVGCLSLADFQTCLDVFAGPLFAGLDAADLVVAGGAVLHALLLDNTVGDDTAAIRARAKAARGSSDVDIFVVAEEEATARAAFDRVVAHFKARLAADVLPHRELMVVRSPLAVSLYAGHPQRTVQIILRRHACIADVIFGFDVDACQLAYDGSAVYATPSAARAFRTGINVADPERSSNSYERRLAKYATRGFAVAVPGLELERVASRYKDGVFAWAPGRNLRRLSHLRRRDTRPIPLAPTTLWGCLGFSSSSLRGSLREEEQRTALSAQQHFDVGCGGRR